MSDTQLARIGEIEQRLAAARTIDELKDIRDKAEAVRVYVKQTHEKNLALINHAAEVKLRAERRLGEMLEELPKHPAGRPAAIANTLLAIAKPPTLAQMGISDMESSRWQAIARVPEARFEGYIGVQKQQGIEITTADVLRMAPRRQPVLSPPIVTLSRWHAMSARERERSITEAPRDSRAGLNRHRDEDAERAIEWAIWSRNVVTGCEHTCPYCYARDIANRLFPYGFEPAFHPDRLHSPRNVRVPLEPDGIGHKNIFSDSMADLFGKWVPQEWIDAELAVARECPQWNFLYLTKFPQRMAQQDWPPNAWVGTSVDSQARARTAERVFRGVAAGVRWLSCEPMLERLTFSTLEGFDWIVVGGATSSSQTPAFTPPAEWVEHLIAQANAAGCQVYLKRNLDYRHEYPGQEIAQ
jgi:protein gp37